MKQCIYDLWEVFPSEVRQYVNAVQESENIDTWQACLKGVGLLAQTAEVADKYFKKEV